MDMSRKCGDVHFWHFHDEVEMGSISQWIGRFPMDRCSGLQSSTLVLDFHRGILLKIDEAAGEVSAHIQ
jgi:hypothetical protein